jgi:hypothetical protein
VPIRSLLNHFGVDPVKTLSGAVSDAEPLDNPEDTIPYKTMGVLMELAAVKPGARILALKWVVRLARWSLELIGELMQCANPSDSTSRVQGATFGSATSQVQHILPGLSLCGCQGMRCDGALRGGGTVSAVIVDGDVKIPTPFVPHRGHHGSYRTGIASGLSNEKGRVSGIGFDVKGCAVGAQLDLDLNRVGIVYEGLDDKQEDAIGFNVSAVGHGQWSHGLARKPGKRH